MAAAKAQADAEAAAQEQVQANIAIPFNRTMRLLQTYNLPPTQDGIHDPANEGINMLHVPLEAYADLPRNQAGNRVNWVAALGEKKIIPRWDIADAQAEGLVMDMNIIRTPRGSIPNVVFPHKQHTEWLACSNCHPAIFVPQKGANQINMRLILSGEKCGVCHGKVAFPPSECRLCHSQKKELSKNEMDVP
ncbi:MAG: cytochrome c3 family protein [Gallionellaceae bacterium]|nr:cytochrome c3 family protein [Gallionellaceae bacterium]